MAYVDVDDPNILTDINRRKEYHAFPPSKSYPNFFIDVLMKRGMYLQFMPSQHLISNFISPQTPYSRILIKWSTGMGKTLTALFMSLNFIDFYKKLDSEIGSVYIIGFSGRIFRNELLTRPELGFISREELQKLRKLQNLSHIGVEYNKKFQEFRAHIQRRFTNRNNNGFFKFIGYKAFVNRLFISNSKDININNLSDEEIIKNIEAKKINVNLVLLESFTNSLMICDEIHNVYNSLDKNNWGIAIQYVLDNVKSVRAAFLSATPLNNNPSEIVDITNLVTGKKLKKIDYFSKDGHIKPGALEKIANMWKGRVSFLRDANPKYFPSRTITGESIKGIDYLKFIRCPMSSFQYNTYKSFYTGTLPQDERYIIDFALPNPKSEKIGLFRTQNIKQELSGASQSWKDKNKIDFRNNRIVGEIANVNIIKKYSGKYHRVISDIIDLVKKKIGKIFVYHKIVHMSGILFIEELLKRNGFIGDGIGSTDSTICVICGLTRGNHKNTHDFKPSRYLIVRGELNQSKITQIKEKYNHPSNKLGHNFVIFIGSQMIQEAHNFLAIRELLITSRPDNISALKQLLGRGIRNNSHSLLEPGNRNVNIRIYTSCLPNKDKDGYIKSHEEIKYMEKMRHYKVIQLIDKKVFHENAIDASINKDTILPKDPIKDPLGDFNILPFKISKDFPDKKLNIKDLNLSTFNVFHAEKEVEMITIVIKRLFIETSSVWSYEELWKAVKNPPFDAKMNAAMFSQYLFNIALTKLLYLKNRTQIEPYINLEEKGVIDFLLDPNEKIILLPSGQRSIISYVGKYYILFPVDDYNRPIIDVETAFRTRKVIEKVSIDIESFLSDFSNIYNYEEKKEKFYYKWSGVSIENLESAVCDFGTDFHIQFIEECVKYIFDVWVSRDMKKSKFHDFYFKMIHYYSMRDLIIWAHTSKEDLFKKYEKYVSAVSENIQTGSTFKLIFDKKKLVSTSGLINLLKSSINNSSLKWCPSEARDKYKKHLDASLKLFSRNRKKSKPAKVPADYLPIGHFLKNTPRFYHPQQKWYDLPEYLNTRDDYKENPVIIGYDERTKTAINTRFKIRPPIQKIKIHKDTRKIEKGSVCSNSRSKEYLTNLLKKLGIPEDKTNNVDSLCSMIRVKLIYNELNERINKTKIKWFYFSYEKQPVI